jgi:hypothetical protein
MFDVKDITELRKLLKMCRAQGVTEFTSGIVSFKLGDLPQEEQVLTQEEVDQQTLDEAARDRLVGFPSEQELMDWSLPRVDQGQKDADTQGEE